MKSKIIVLLLALLPAALAQNQKPQTLKGVLLDQLHSTHDQSGWFVCGKVAVQGLTPEQASWKDRAGNHSVGQLLNHIVFWNQRSLEKFEGKKSPAFSGNNDETFNNFDAKSWAATVQRFDTVMKAWEKAVEDADDAKLKQWASDIAHIGAHNAYHIGEIVYVRKEQGSWDPSKGVK